MLNCNKLESSEDFKFKHNLGKNIAVYVCDNDSLYQTYSYVSH